MSVESVYRYVVQQVIKNSEADFQNSGIDDPERLLEDLRQLWLSKLLSSGAIAPMGVEADYDNRYYHHPVHPQYDHPYGNYYPPEALSTNYSDSSYYLNLPQNYASRDTQLPSIGFPPVASHLPHTDYEASIGRPQPYLAPPASWADPAESPVGQFHYRTERHINPRDDKAYKLPQQDGSSDQEPSETTKTTNLETTKEVDAVLEKKIRETYEIPQVDGGDDYNEFDRSPDDDENDDENNLGSEDDDDDDREPETDHLVICQFEKVTRIKNKRKTSLKGGIMRLNGRDYLFSRANGEFDF